MVNNQSQKRIAEFRVSWTADHEQYFPGHGIAFTDWTHCAVGCGETLRESFEDAVGELDFDSPIDRTQYNEMLAELTTQVQEPEMLDWDIVKAECDEEGEHEKTCPTCDGYNAVHADEFETTGSLTDCETCDGGGTVTDEDPDCAVCAGEWHYYVMIDVKVEGGDNE